MQLQRKAVYNLLQINLDRIESGELKIADLEPWQLENYRQQSTDDLLARLSHLGLAFDDRDFLKRASSFEEPEEMVDAVAASDDPREKDHLFLVLFELWRRLIPERRTLSIFCDELDYQMTRHDLGDPSEIQDYLAYLQELLEENVDAGLDPSEAYEEIKTYLANDVTSFLFEFILTQIDEGNPGYAHDLLEGYAPYLSDELWFEYLQARLEYLDCPAKGGAVLTSVVEHVDEETSITLIEEMLYFLVETENHALFDPLAQKMIGKIELEEDFKEFLEICYLHFKHIEADEAAEGVSHIFHERTTIEGDRPLSSKDPHLKKVRTLLRSS